MAEAQDVNLLKRRGRRRLVGAVALVLIAVVVLPMVFDPEPRQSAPPISVRIPDEDDARFTPKLAPQPPVDKGEAQAPAPAPQAAAPAAQPSRPEASAAPKPAPAPSAAAKPAAAPPAAKPAAAPSARDAAGERQRAERALRGGDFVVQVAALGEDDKVKALTERLAAAKLPYYTEPVAIAKGTVTRVRVGPFATRAAAERAAASLTAMGLKPGSVLERP